MKKIFILILLITAIVGSSCKKKTDDSSSTPTVSALAVVGTTWSSSGNGNLVVSQVSGTDVVVTCTYGSNSIAVTGSMTTTGFADYFYSSGDKSKPFTLVNFDDAVGTQYKYNLGSVQVVRTVISKSTTDDFYVPALSMYIKTIDVKEDVPAGLTVNGKVTPTKTIYWSLNHKFGIVYARVVKTDGTILEFPLTSTNAGTK
ncbi:MAG: hypothetical protein NTU51_09505 [Bacteroidetes bacterium]|nr:hypothetical protein [Bacteroidota bacterium]